MCVSDHQEVCVCIIYKKLAGSVSQLLGIFSVLCHIFIDIYTYTYNKQNSTFNGWTLYDEVLFMYIEDCIILEQTMHLYAGIQSHRV